MNQSKSRVTYIICHHNYEEFLTSAINSAKNQTYKCHICFIDDCSDNQQAVKDIIGEKLFGGQKKQESILGEKSETWKNNNFTAIFLKDGPYGPSYARNRGIEETLDTTDIFAILDADDENYPTKIERLVKVLDLIPSIGVAYADYDILNTSTNEIRREYKELYDLHRLNQECIVHSGSLIKKDALLKIKEQTGFYDETLRVAEDYDLWLRISDHFMITHVAEPLSLVRIQPKNSTDTVAKDIWEQSWRKVNEKRMRRHNQ